MSKRAPAFPALRERRDLRRTALLAAVLLTAVLPREAGAQENVVHVEPGTRIRVTAPPVLPRPLAGWLVELRSDTLVLATPGTNRIAVPRQSVQRLELSLGRDRGNGALRGAFAGLLLGSLVELVAPQDGDGGPDGPCFPCTDAGVSAVLGAVVGAALGAILAPERWERIGR